MSKPLKQFLFDGRKAAMDPSTTKERWIDLIREGRTITPGELSWAVTYAVVQMAIVGSQGDKIKEMILLLFKSGDTSGDTDLCRKMANIAAMFDDPEFEKQFKSSALDAMLHQWAHRQRLGQDDIPYDEV